MEKQNYYQPEIECASREQIKEWQSEGLVKTVKHAYENSPYYRRKMDEHGVKPEDIKSLDDLHKLPFICKDDLREAYPYGLLCKPLSECVRIQSTSGTTGKRVIAFYTQHDIDAWDDCCARAIAAVGGTKDDVVHVSYGYGLFTGGAGLNGGSHKLGSLTLPMSSGSTDRQIQFMQDLGSTILCCTPSYAAYLGETVVEKGLQDTIKLKAGIFGAEAWSEEMRRDIEAKLGIKAYDIYGLTELEGPGVSYECCEQHGMHICEDQFIAEIINPNTGEVLPDGEKGELVFTSINKEAFPMIRYRTRDITRIINEECACGRTHRKIDRIIGRSDDMMIIRGVNVFPQQIEQIITGFDEITAHYQIVLTDNGPLDKVTLNVETVPEFPIDEIRKLEDLKARLGAELKSNLQIKVDIKIVEPKSIERSEGKAKRVIDLREGKH